MKPGIYRLRQDVPNPMKIDRRRTDWMNQEVFKKGNLFVRTDHDDLDVGKPLPRLGFREYTIWTYKHVNRVEALLKDLEPHLEPVDPKSSLRMLLLYYREVRMGSASNGVIVETLLKEGTLTLDDIEALLIRVNPD